MTEAPAVLDRSGLDKLVAAPIADGNRVVHLTVRDDAIVLAELDSGAQLPAGRGVGVSPRPYRLRVAVLARPAGRSRASSYRLGLQRPALLLDMTGLCLIT